MRPFHKYLSRLPGHIVLIGVLIAVGAGASGVLWASRSTEPAEPVVEAAVLPQAARIERVDGDVVVARGLTEEEAAELAWEEAVRNAPLTAGDRVYAPEGARAALAFTGRNYARLDPGSALDVLTLTDERTQLALRDGSAIFDIGELGDGDLFEVATPNGAYGFYEPGLYQVGIGDDGNTWISVLSGLAQVVGLAGTGEVSRGEMLTLVGATAAQVLMSQLAPDLAGGIVDDYYGYRYPDLYDGRYRDYEAYYRDPDYYAPYRRSVSYRHVPYDVPGLYDLDGYGDWVEVDGYGACWTPRVDEGWAPYRDGYWDVNHVYGPTWVSNEPWGWAPYHYGRWAYVSGRQWVWVPERVDRRPAYAPALVAFVPVTRTNQVGWVPLAPGEPYVPRYYDEGYRPHYLGSRQMVTEVVTVRRTYANAGYPQAITVVPVDSFTRRIRRGVYSTADAGYLAGAQPVLDPFAIDDLRQAARRQRERKRRFKLERAFRNQDAPVVVSAAPVPSPGRARRNEALRFATVTEKQKKNRLQVERRAPVAFIGGSNAPAQARQQRIAELRTRAARGDQAARREMKQLKREQRAAGVTAPPRVIAVPSPARQARPAAAQDPERAARKAQKRAERQQRRAAPPAAVNAPARPALAPQQPAANPRKQARAARKAARQSQVYQQPVTAPRAAPANAPRQPAVNPQKQQMKAAKRAARQQQVIRPRVAPQANRPAPNTAPAQVKPQKAARSRASAPAVKAKPNQPAKQANKAARKAGRGKP